ncbi:hypothetical protein MPNT_40167 [Candidatus Methylacidithermus pantelleriae]|uniref:Uncharacterized protein n=1 Tax=Candidatus Methylacidithermus pantelleriae TaxID=2744239 RepID=A0A8J2FSX4_9BACT|nr:hypothetical protein MPNT_40167 [Candidatus Methylacidithermus pantelleriae]
MVVELVALVGLGVVARLGRRDRLVVPRY